MSFAQYLFPLAVLEIYLRVQDRPSTLRRLTTAGILFVLTLAMGAGIFAVTMAVWMPQVKAGFDPRKSIAQILSATIASSGIDRAVQQYHDLKATGPTSYNFDGGSSTRWATNSFTPISSREAIRIFRLNVEAYPQSSNVYDSLAEAYMDDGDKSQAIANYQESLQRNPKNRNAVQILHKLNAP